jgi:di/tricarboxylate transporter
MVVFGSRLLAADPEPAATHAPAPLTAVNPPAGEDPALYPVDAPFDPLRAGAALGVFVLVVTVAALGLLPIAAAAFAGAVLLVVTGMISVDNAYKGLRPDILLLIAGMVVVGLSMEVTGLAALATDALVGWLQQLGPLYALALIYGATLLLTEILSNAAVAVLLTPIAVALAESLGVNPRPFLVAVMMAASAAFATPFGYQTNVLVYQMGGYRYLDFVRIGAPLNLITWAVGLAVIPMFFPF